MLASVVIAILAVPASVLAHGVVSIPTPRKGGPKQAELCGVNVTATMNNDKAGPIENAMAKIRTDYKCNAYLCRGYQYEDNKSNVIAYKAGALVTFHIDLVAAHKPGYSNVSVIQLATNTAIGAPVKSWDVWPDNVAGGGDDVDFNITIPSTLGTACNVGGKCALQWFWYSKGNSQTYESCVDFYVTS
ncbi:unnamed protein product [Discula destructiva]